MSAKTYTVAIYKPVMDVLRCFVEVEAETAEEAVEKALDIDPAELDDKFTFWQCGDCNEPITAEVTEPGPGWIKGVFPAPEEPKP